VSGALPDGDGGCEAVHTVVRSPRQVAAVGPGTCLGREVLPGFFVEFPGGQGGAAGLVVDEFAAAQLGGDGPDEFVEPVVGLARGSQAGRGRELRQDLPVPGRLREAELSGRFLF
jgi:hypothetical protein